MPEASTPVSVAAGGTDWPSDEPEGTRGVNLGFGTRVVAEPDGVGRAEFPSTCDGPGICGVALPPRLALSPNDDGAFIPEDINLEGAGSEADKPDSRCGATRAPADGGRNGGFGPFEAPDFPFWDWSEEPDIVLSIISHEEPSNARHYVLMAHRAFRSFSKA